MNQGNYSQMKTQLRYTGFGESLFATLEQKMRSGAPEFTISIACLSDGKPLEAVLYFRKSKTSDWYYFNYYRSTLRLEEGSRTQRFSIGFYAPKNITLKESGNLLWGRAVCKSFVPNKDMQRLKAGEDVPVQEIWVQLDLNHTDRNGYRVVRYYASHGYDVKRTLQKKGLMDRIQRDQLLLLVYHLKKENRFQTTLAATSDEPVMPVYLQTLPLHHTFEMFDLRGTPLFLPNGMQIEEQVLIEN